MSSNIDRRIVDMQFNNEQFEKGVSQSVSSLDRLKKALNLDGAAKGLDSLDRMNNVNVDDVAKSLDRAKMSFSALQVVGYTALVQLTKGAMELGGKLVKFIYRPLEQIKQGGKQRAQNIEQARFQMKGLGLDVEEAMKNSLDAVDGTAYGLDQAARAAGQLAASGVELGKDMTTTLRGISGLSAMTNRDFDSVAHIFTKVAGNGRLMGMELNQLSTYGVNAAATLAEHFGKTEAEIRDMVSKGQVSFQMFSEAMSEAFGEHATKANETYAGSLLNVKSALSRIGEKFYTPYYENMRDVLNSIRPVINDFNKGLDPMFQAIERLMLLSKSNVVKTLEGINLDNMGQSMMEVLIPAMDVGVNLGYTFSAILTAIKEAWRTIFPSSSIQPLVNVLTYIAKLTEQFRITEETASALQRILSGVFAVFDIGVIAVGGTIKVLAEFGRTIATMLAPVTGVIFEILASIGDFFVMFRDLVRTGISPLESFRSALSKFNDDMQGGTIFHTIANNIRKGVSGIKGALGGLDDKFLRFLETVGMVISNTFKSLGYVFEYISPITQALGRVFRETFGIIKSMFEDLNVIDVLNTGFFAGLVIMISKFGTAMQTAFHGFTQFTSGPGKLLSDVKKVLVGYQTQLKSKSLLSIAGAIALMAGSLLVLSTIPADRVMTSLAAISIVSGVLMTSFTALGRIKGRIMTSSVAILSFATALLVLSSAVKKLSSLNLKEVAIGVGAVSALMWQLVAMSSVMSANKTKMIQGSLGLVAFSAGISILAGAVKKLGNLDLSELGKGLLGMTVLLGQIVIFMKATQGLTKGLPSFAAGLILLATSMNLLVLPLYIMGNMPWQTLVQGLVGLAGVLITIAAAAKMVNVIAPSLGILGVKLTLLAIGLTALTIPLLAISAIPLSAIGKGLASIAGMFTVIGLAALILQPLQGSLIGVSAGMILFGTALTLLVPPIAILGSMKIATIAKALMALAGIFAVLGVAGALLTPLAPSLLILGAAIALMGAGASLAGTGLVLLATGLSAVLATLTGAAGTLPFILTSLGETVSASAEALAKISITLSKVFLETLREIAPEFITTIANLLVTLMETLAVKGPEFVNAGIDLIIGLLDAFKNRLPEFLEIGTDIVVILIKGIADGIPRIVETGISVVVNFLIAIGQQLPRVVDAGFEMIISFINGMTDTIRTRGPELSKAIEELISAMLGAAWDVITSPVKGVFKMGVNVITGLLDGLKSKAADLIQGGKDVGSRFLKGFRDFFEIHSPSVRMFKEAQLVDRGFRDGLAKSKLSEQAAETKAKSVTDSFKKGLNTLFKLDDVDKTETTAKESMGHEVAKGVADGITKDKRPEQAAAKKAESIVDSFKEALSKLDLSMSTINLENELWSVTNESTSKGAKAAQQIQHLNNQIAIQQQKVNVVTEEYNRLLTTLGQSHEDTQKSYNQMLQEKISLTKLSNELNDIDKNATDTYFDYLVRNGKQLQEMGYTAEQIEADARKKSGYGVQVDNMNQTMTASVEKAVTSAMTAVSTTYTKQAPATLAPLVNTFDTWGKGYAGSIGDGFINGLKEVMTKVRAALDSMDREVRTTLDRIRDNMRRTMDQISSLGTPVIAPVMDMTNIDAAMASIGSNIPIIDPQVSRAKASAASGTNQASVGESPGPKNITNNINMTQNNTSPKALSRVDIYRQTKTQLAQATDIYR